MSHHEVTVDRHFLVLFVVLVVSALIIVIVIVNLLLCEGELEAASKLALYSILDCVNLEVNLHYYHAPTQCNFS